jgi:tellurite resistance protein TehA-like permease
MATGIVSGALRGAGARGPAAALAWIAVALGALTVAALGARLLAGRDTLLAELSEPAALTVVAAGAVLGSLAVSHGATGAGGVLLAVSVAAGVPLYALVVPRLGAHRAGARFLVVVAAEGLAILAARLAADAASAALLGAALVLAVLGALAYPWAGRGFDLGELARGAGDHWVAGGAAAITALTFCSLDGAAAALGWSRAVRDALGAAGTVAWVVSLAWAFPLAVAEVRHRRPAFDARRWATVFPLGMYAVASLAVGRAEGLPVGTGLGRGMAVVAAMAWLVVAAGAVRRGITASAPEGA